MTIKEPEDLPTIVAEEIAAAQKNNIPPHDLKDYVRDKVRFRMEGTEVYIRKSLMSSTSRAADIRARFNGKNKGDLAKEHGITERRVRQIVNGK